MSEPLDLREVEAQLAEFERIGPRMTAALLHALRETRVALAWAERRMDMGFSDAEECQGAITAALALCTDRETDHE